MPISIEVLRERERRIGQLRAQYIEQTIEIETWLDNVLESLFSPQTGDEPVTSRSLIQTVVLRDPTLSLGKKINYLSRIAKELDKPKWNHLIQQLHSVRRRRNLLAHQKSSPVGVEDAPTDFRFLEQKSDGGVEEIIVTQATINEWHRHAANVDNDVANLFTELNPWILEE